MDATSLMEGATKAAGVAEFDDTGFVDDLSRWLVAVEAEAGLTPAGEAGVEQNVVRLLANRLWIEADQRAHLEIHDEVVTDPIVVVGLPRTGTTKLQRMLSADSRAQKLAFWRVLTPGRPVRDSSGEPDPRIGIAQMFVAFSAQVPEIMAAHPFAVEDADEEAIMLEMTFRSLLSAMRARVPSYLEWFVQSPQLPNYQYLRSLLQSLQWQDGGRRGRHWVLKAPYHLGNLDSLMEVFPGATVVQCHRDPRVAVPSACRLVEVYRRTTAAAVDAVDLGQEMLGYLAGEMTKNLAQRQRLEGSAVVIDAAFEEIARDPLAIVRALYSARGVPLTSKAKTAMAGWAAANLPPAPGEHAYALERYGLSETAIERRFGGYLDRFEAYLK